MSYLMGLSMDLPLLISAINEHGAEAHGRTEIVSYDLAGQRHCYSFLDMNRRSKRLANALTARGMGLGKRVATLAWNTHRHMEIFYGATGMGCPIHTVNPRLTTEHLEYIINEGAAEVLFLDADLVPRAVELAGKLPHVRHFVVLEPRENLPDGGPLALESYEDWLAAESDQLQWPEFDERSASTICFTSGTTGLPKGVVYSHRATVLQTMTFTSMGWLPPTRRGKPVLLAVAPMFHSNAWNFPFGALYAGVPLVLPGRNLSPENLQRVIADEGVTCAALVPSILTNIIEHVLANELDLGRLESVVTSGAGAAPKLIAWLHEHGIATTHSWGMTECMFGTSGALLSLHADLPLEERMPYLLKDGRQTALTRIRIVDDEGNVLPRDGTTRGHLRVRGLWAARGYLNQPENCTLDRDGWLITGDIATIDPDGYLKIVDRDKDLIKSGGEWISSSDLEKIAASHPDVVQAAAIAVNHPKWQERPLLIVQLREGAVLDAQAILELIDAQVAKWWVPDDVVQIAEFPLSATGKVRKMDLRETYADYYNQPGSA